MALSLEQLERRLRELEQSTRGLDYVALKDARDAEEEAEKKATKKSVHSDDTNA